MTTEWEPPEDWDPEVDAYDGRQAQKDVVHLAGHELWFLFRIDPNAITRDLWADRTMDEVSLEYRRQVESELNPPLKETNLSLRAEAYGGPKTGGPVPDQQYALYLIGIAFAAMAGIVTIRDFAGIVRNVIGKAREMTSNDVAISNGLAVILAAEAIFDATGKDDLTFAFETPLARYMPDLGEWDSDFDGWLVGFRSRERLHVARVSSFGEVTMAPTDILMDWKPED
jgi:hypothetical protein